MKTASAYQFPLVRAGQCNDALEFFDPMLLTCSAQ
jgi:hypothetical protein